MAAFRSMSMVDTFKPSGLSVTSLLLTSLVIIVTYFIYTVLFDPLAKIPGPLPARFTRLWYFRMILRWDVHKQLGPLHEKYGPIVRVSPKEIWISDPEYVKTIYGAGSGFTKGSLYWKADAAGLAVRGDVLDFFPELNVERYRAQRRLVGPIYAPTNVKKYEPLMARKIEQFLTKMKKMQGQLLDLEEWTMVLALDSFSYLTWSSDFGSIEAGHSSGLTASNDDKWKGFCTVGIFPKVHLYQHYFRTFKEKLQGSFGKPLVSILAVRSPNLFQKACQKAEERRKERDEGIRRIDLMEDLFTLNDRNPLFKDHWADSMSRANIAAGHETTTLSLLSIISHIAWLPGCQARIQAEVDQALQMNNLSIMPSYAETLQLKYLNICIHEAMRLEPVIAQPMPRMVPIGGMNVGDYYLPPGTTVGASAQVVQRNKSIFGEDADTFNPSRWENISPEKARTMNSISLVWGGASRSCPGQFLAKQFIPVYLAALYIRFDVHVLDKEEAAELGWMYKEESHFVMSRRGLMFKLQERSPEVTVN